MRSVLHFASHTLAETLLLVAGVGTAAAVGAMEQNLHEVAAICGSLATVASVFAAVILHRGNKSRGQSRTRKPRKPNVP